MNKKYGIIAFNSFRNQYPDKESKNRNIFLIALSMQFFIFFSNLFLKFINITFQKSFLLHKFINTFHKSILLHNFINITFQKSFLLHKFINTFHKSILLHNFINITFQKSILLQKNYET